MAEKFSGRAPTFRSFIQEQPNIPWIIAKLLPDVGKTLLVGPSGIGKTTLALQMAYAIQEGLSFFSRDTMQKTVLYIQMDCSDIEWREIIRRVAPSSLARTLVNAPMYCLDNDAYVAAIGNLINQAQAGFIIWDSFYKLSSRGVNTDKVMMTIHQLNMLCGDVPYMVLHHPPHNESRASGHNALEASFSNNWFLTKTKLLVNKGWLVEDKEVLMHREQKHPGLWQSDGTVGHGTNDKESTSSLDDYVRGTTLYR